MHLENTDRSAMVACGLAGALLGPFAMLGIDLWFNPTPFWAGHFGSVAPDLALIGAVVAVLVSRITPR